MCGQREIGRLWRLDTRDLKVVRVELDHVVLVEGHNCFFEDEPARAQESSVDTLKRVLYVT